MSEVELKETSVSSESVQDATQSKEAPISEKVVEVTKPLEEVKAEAIPSYQPNYKFKITNAQQMEEEKEFDEFLRASIKDEKQEKTLRELYEKAHGIDFVKTDRDSAKKRAQEAESKYNEFHSQVSDIVSLRDKDFWGFCEAVGLTKEQVAQKVLDEVKRLELPEDQKRMYDEFDKTRRRELQLEKQLQEEQRRSQESAIQARTHELDTVLQRPEISAYAKAYDTARKKSGAFREAVIRHGIAEWNVNQRDIASEQAVFDVMSILGEAYRGNGTAMPTTPTLPNAEDKPLPVIPRVSGKAVSPTGKAPRSIEDLKKMAAELAG